MKITVGRRRFVELCRASRRMQLRPWLNPDHVYEQMSPLGRAELLYTFPEGPEFLTTVWSVDTGSGTATGRMAMRIATFLDLEESMYDHS